MNSIHDMTAIRAMLARADIAKARKYGQILIGQTTKGTLTVTAEKNSRGTWWYTVASTVRTETRGDAAYIRPILGSFYVLEVQS